MTLRLNGSTSGYTEIDAPAVAGSNTIVLPSGNGSANQLLKNGSTAGTLGWSSMVETATGVGIGTSSPSSLLHLEASDGVAQIRLQRSGTNIYGIIRQTSAPYGLTYDAVDVNTSSPAHAFRTSVDGSTFTERTRIRGDGYLLHGCTSTPSSSVVGFSLSPSVTSVDSHKSSSGSTTTSVQHFAFINGNGTVGEIRTNGSGTSFGTSSDYRLKENVVAISDAFDRVKQLKPSRFNFKADPSVVVDGFLAHEVQSLVPEAIAGEKDAVDHDGSPIYQSIDQSKLVPLLAAALKEAITKIEALETRIAALEVTP